MAMAFTAARPLAGIMLVMATVAAIVMFVVKQQLPAAWMSWSTRELRKTSTMLVRRRWLMRAGGEDAFVSSERGEDETEREMRARLRAEGVERRRGARDALRMRILQREVKALRAEVRDLRRDVAASVALVERQIRVIGDRS